MRVQVADAEVYIYTNNKAPDPDKPSVTFVHGAGFDHGVWTLFARHFSRLHWNVLSVDLPGHGRSGGRPLMSVEAMSEWLVSVLDTLGINETALVGHSMGSLISVETAAQHGDRINRLVLIGGIAPMPVSPPILEATANQPSTAHSMLTSFGFGKANLLGGNPNPGMWMVGESMRRYEDEASDALDTDMRACNQYNRGLAAAATVSCPTLMIHGDADRLTPLKATRQLLAALPSGRIVLINGAGHTLMMEAPNVVLDHLKAHLIDPAQ